MALRVDLLGLEESSLAQAGIEVRRRFGAHPPVRLDRMKFTRVLLKLIKFTRETMRNSPTRARALDIEIDEIDGQVRVRLSGTGDAALPADPSSLFVPDPTAGHTGAHDLHFCGNIVIEMGGSIRLAPRPDQPGATSLRIRARAPSYRNARRSRRPSSPEGWSITPVS